MRRHYEWIAELQEAGKAQDLQKIDDLTFGHFAFMFEVEEKDLDDYETEEISLAVDKLILKMAQRKITKTAEMVREEIKPKMPEKKTVKKRPSKK